MDRVVEKRMDLLGRAPLVLPTLIMTTGVVAGFYAGTIPVMLLVVAIALALVAAFTRGRLIVPVVAIVVFILGWAMACLRMGDGQRVDGEVMEYRAVVTDTHSYKHGVGLDLVVLERGVKLRATLISDDSPAVGSLITARSRWRGIDVRRNGFERYLLSQGVDATTFLHAEDYRLEGYAADRLSAWQQLRMVGNGIQRKLAERLRSIAPDDGGMAVAAAMTVGDKRAVPQELRGVYSTTGVGHLLALSGWHLSLIYFLLMFFLPRRSFPSMVRLVAVGLIWLYVLMVGMPVSAVRAALMLTAYAMADVAGRSRASLNSIALAALVILLFEPAACFDAGFIMSVAAVVGIALLYGPLCRLLRYAWLKWLAVTVAAQMGVWPVVLCLFGTFSPYFALSNMLAMPMAMLGVYLAALSLLTAPLSGLWGLSFIHTATMELARWTYSVLNAVLGFMASLPGACLHWEGVDVVQAVLLYIMEACLVASFVVVRRMWLRRRTLRKMLNR